MESPIHGGQISLSSVETGLLSPTDTQSVSPVQGHNSVAFVKGGKRKRLSKACDACHKSKRRCDGTAPCSNCYFASKKCTYTDSSGRPVPAPRNAAHGERTLTSAAVNPTDEFGSQPAELSEPVPNPPFKEHVVLPKRNRPDNSSNSPREVSSSEHSPRLAQPSEPQSRLLNPDTTHELVNLFFAHCNPHRLILHKPSFSAALSHSRVPEYLVLAICAVAAPLSKSISSQASIARVAGVPFYQDAVKIMFDNAGRLLSETTLETAQALCLMEMHEIAASHSWTKHNKYFDLALKVLEESLEVEKPDDRVRSHSSYAAEGLDFRIERECTRRCFWLVQCMSWISGIYIYKPVRPRSMEMTKRIRLPIDETTFELAAHWNSATVEYLHVRAPTTRYASQFGHVCRILTIYQTVQYVVVQNEGPARANALIECRRLLDDWQASLPQHLRFSEENVQKQIDMFETSSNTGAWCFCFMHALYPCSYLALLEGEGRLAEPIQWVRDQLGTIFNATGTRAKNTILSACVIWSYSKYHPDDPKIRVWDSDFEKVWGFRVLVVADQWRQAQERDRAQASASPNSSPPQGTTVSPTTAQNQVLVGPGRQAGVDAQYHGDTEMDHRYDHHPMRRPRIYVPGTDLPVQAPNHQRDGAPNLPSLKASGLLDTFPPPSDAFAAALSITPQQIAPPQDERRSVSTLLNMPAHSIRGNVPVTSNPMMPVGLDWLDKP